jgi:hypothetical protein
MENACGERTRIAPGGRRSGANNRHYFAGIDGSNLKSGDAIGFSPHFEQLTALWRFAFLVHRDEARTGRLRRRQAGPGESHNHGRYSE